MPLYQQDQTYCTDIQNRLRFVSNESGEEHKRQHEKYVARRSQCMQPVFRELFISIESDTESPPDEF